MKNIWLLPALLFIVIFSSCQGEKGFSGSLKTQKDSLSYAIGANVGKSLAKDSVDVDPAIVAQAIKDAIGNKAVLGDSAIQIVFKNFGQQRMTKLSEANRKQGEAFLSANMKKEGVVSLPSGLQYRILVQGNGRRPAMNDTVVFNYRGMLIDGKEFSSSFEMGHPAMAVVQDLIKGWSEAFVMMPVGSKWELFVPPSLAYGERGVPPTIGPNSTLMFEIELLAVK